jgi:hypothetical protein
VNYGLVGTWGAEQRASWSEHFLTSAWELLGPVLFASGLRSGSLIH